jgi:aldose 1-epimerase
MFSIHNKTENGFEKVILKNDKSNSYTEIIPSCGAILHAYVAQQNGKPVNVIESYASADEFKNQLTKKGFLGCKLSPFVCRINKAKYEFGKKKYHIKKSLPAKHALHGELYDKPFIVTSQIANELHASVTMKYEYRSEDPGYPFNYDCIVTWQLEDENKLSVTTECINKDQGLIPMADGWHPYFTLGDKVDNLQLEFQSKEMVEFNNELIPTQNLIPYSEFISLKKIESTNFDNCFTLHVDSCQPLCVLRNAEKKIEIEIHPGKSYPYLQIYIPQHRNSIAIENISAAPDAFNNQMGLTTLEAGQSALFSTFYKIVFLK